MSYFPSFILRVKVSKVNVRRGKCNKNTKVVNIPQDTKDYFFSLSIFIFIFLNNNNDNDNEFFHIQ